MELVRDDLSPRLVCRERPGGADAAGALCGAVEPAPKVVDMLKGALAAALTPLRDAGEALDEAAVGPYVDFLAAGGVRTAC